MANKFLEMRLFSDFPISRDYIWYGIISVFPRCPTAARFLCDLILCEYFLKWTMCLMALHPRSWITLKRVSATAILVAVLAGSSSLVGWCLDLVPLKSVSPDLPIMVPNTALSLVLAGAALELLRQEPVSRFRRGLAKAAATVVTLIGAVTLTEYLFDLDLQVDRFLVYAPAEMVLDPYLARPGFPTAWALVLIGLAIWLIDLRPRGSATRSAR